MRRFWHRLLLAAGAWVALLPLGPATAQDPEPLGPSDIPRRPTLTREEVAAIREILPQLVGLRVRGRRASQLHAKLDRFRPIDPRTRKRADGFVVSSSNYDRGLFPLRGGYWIRTAHRSVWRAGARYDTVSFGSPQGVLATYGTPADIRPGEVDLRGRKSTD